MSSRRQRAEDDEHAGPGSARPLAVLADYEGLDPRRERALLGLAPLVARPAPVPVGVNASDLELELEPVLVATRRDALGRVVQKVWNMAVQYFEGEIGEERKVKTIYNDGAVKVFAGLAGQERMVSLFDPDDNTLQEYDGPKDQERLRSATDMETGVMVLFDGPRDAEYSVGYKARMDDVTMDADRYGRFTLTHPLVELRGRHNGRDGRIAFDYKGPPIPIEDVD